MKNYQYPTRITWEVCDAQQKQIESNTGNTSSSLCDKNGEFVGNPRRHQKLNPEEYSKLQNYISFNTCFQVILSVFVAKTVPMGLVPKSSGKNNKVNTNKGHPSFRAKRKKNEHRLRFCQAACPPCFCRCCRSRSSCSGRPLPGQTCSETFPSSTSSSSRKMGCNSLPSPRSARWWSMSLAASTIISISN